MSEENELDVCNKGADVPHDYENSNSPKKDMSLEPIVRIKQENVKDSDEEDFDSELEEEEEIDSASEDSEFDDEAESEEELQEEDENGKLQIIYSLKKNLFITGISLLPHQPLQPPLVSTRKSQK